MADFSGCPDPGICEATDGDNVKLGFLLTAIAGIATCIGAAIPFISKRFQKPKYLSMGLALSAGVMLYVSFVEIFSGKSMAYLCCYSEKYYTLISTVCFFSGIIITYLLGILSHFIKDLQQRENRQRFVDNLKYVFCCQCFRMSKSSPSSALPSNTIIPKQSASATVDLTQKKKNAANERATTDMDTISLKRTDASVSDANPMEEGDGIREEEEEEVENCGSSNQKDQIEKAAKIITIFGNCEVSGGEATPEFNDLENEESSNEDSNSNYDSKMNRENYKEMRSKSLSHIHNLREKTHGPDTYTLFAADKKMKEIASKKAKIEQERLKNVGVMTAIAICIHNFPEGLATFVAALSDPSLGIALCITISIHNIPEGFSVALPIYHATGSKLKAFLWAFFSGISELVGALLGYLVLKDSFGPAAYGCTFSIVAGMMVYISLKELLPTALYYDQKDVYVSISCFVGMLIMAISLVLFATI